MHVSFNGTKRIFDVGLYDDGIQLLPPLECGQMAFVLPSPGILSAAIVLAPVFGSIAVTNCWSPASIEKRYFPVLACRASKTAILPAVSTTGVGTPPTGSVTTCRSN